MTGQSASGVVPETGVLPWRPRVVHENGPVDLEAAQAAASALLAALGQRVDADTADTPRRMALAYAEMLTPAAFEMTTFANTDGYDELVVVQDIPVRSVCAHHMLPFVGVAHVGYLPADRIVGLSKLARVVDFLGRRAQTQERLTRQVAESLDVQLSPRGVGVVVEAEHTCMTVRGAQALGTRTVTSTLLGTVRDNPASRAEFLALAHRGKEA